MGQIRIEALTFEEQLQMELQRRSLRTLDRKTLEAIADQLLWSKWHQERIVRALSHHCLELEMEVNSLHGGEWAPVTDEHRRWAQELLGG